MRATEFIVEADSYSPPTLNVGDRILKGKFKNSPAEITGFTQDKHNQPVLKTNRGEVQLFKPRVTKLMDKDVAEDWNKVTPIQELERYANDPTIFISYTVLPKLGINPNPNSSDTPGGVYAYPLSMVYDDIKNDITNVPFYTSSVKYIMVFKYLGKILSTDNFSESDFKSALTRLHGWFGKILHRPNVPFHTDDYDMGEESPFNTLLEYTKTLALKKLKIPPNNIKFSYDSNEKIIPPIVRPAGYVFTWNTLVKKATGYDAFISTKGTIHGGEPIQAMFLSPEKLQVISMITIPKAKKQGVAEGLDEAVGGNYLYHATSDTGLKSILQSGAINAARGAQSATNAQTQLPTVSTTRDWGYASGSNAAKQGQGGIARSAILVLDRNAIEQRYKTLGTSQSSNTRGSAFGKKKSAGFDTFKFLKPFDINKDNTLSKDELDVWQQQTGGKASPTSTMKSTPEFMASYYRDIAQGQAKSKLGGEFEEAVVVPKGALLLGGGVLVGFWVNPKSTLMNDPTVMNDPRRLEIAPGGTGRFVKAKQTQGVAEGFPQPGPSSGAPKQFGSDAKIQTRQMTVKDIISSVPGVPYYNNVVDDWDAKDYSWGVTKKVIEYATYLKDHPESLAKLPPAIVLNGKFEDGAHRVSAIWLLQQRMDPKNPLWKNAKLNVQFVKQGVAESFDQPYKTKSEKSEYGDVDMLAKLPDGSNLSIMFNRQYGDEGEEVVLVEFYRNNSQAVTRDGDAQRIFATVLAAIQQYIKTYKPKRLTFSASKEVEPDQHSESRAKLYDRLVLRYAPAWGYRPLRADTGTIVRYELSRLKQGVAEGKQPGQPVVDAILKAMPIAQEIWFHGSRATGKHRKNSDTDILVVVPDDLVGDQYLGAVRILQKLSTHFDNYDIQPTKSGTNIHRIAQEEGRLLWSNKQGVAEGMGSSSPTRVMRKYLPNDMWDSILSHSGKSKHDNADGSKTSYVWRLRNLTRSWQGREFNAWKQAVEQELGSDYQVTSKWPTPSVRHIQMNDISAQQGVTEASYPGNIGMMEVAKFFNMATPKEKIIFKRLMNMGEKNKAWQLIQKVTGVKLRGKEFDLVAEGLSIDVPNEQWLQDKIDYAKSKGRDQWGAPFFGTTTAYARPDPQVSVVRLELLKGMRNEQDNVRAKDLEWLMAHMEKTGKLPLTKRGEEYAPYVMVAYNGEAWVNDGNHRIMAAYRLGWKTLPVQLAYFDGGERVESGIMYPKKIGL